MNKLKRFHPHFIILLLLCNSCTDNNEISKNCNITSCDVSTLLYPEINRPILYNPNFSNKIYFEYDNQNRIIKILGGLVKISDGANAFNYSFFDGLETNVNYENNNVIIENDVFSIIEDKLNSKKTTESPYYNQIEYNYEYNENFIQELQNGRINKTFYFTNNNLSKVEQIIYKADYSISRKKELIFSDYDNNDNLLKGLFFVSGAFYKAFSDNNFKTLEYKIYNYENNEFILDLENGYSYNLNFELNNDGIVNLFEQNCN